MINSFAFRDGLEGRLFRKSFSNCIAGECDSYQFDFSLSREDVKCRLFKGNFVFPFF